MERTFHCVWPTAVDDEIDLAADLFIAARLRWGGCRLSRLVRRSPSEVWRRFRYVRAVGRTGDNADWALVAAGVEADPASKADDVDILTPDDQAFQEFRLRLVTELGTPDAEIRWSPANRCHCGLSGREYWPLASATLLRAGGYAVAESLASWLAMHCATDAEIAGHLERLWRRVRPSRRRMGERG